jgi:putative tributyrin esterase
MNLATMQFESPALGRHVTYGVILPQIKADSYPVVMQLHGYSDDHTAWLYNTSLIRYASAYPLILVLPNGGTSAYLNLHLNVDPTSSLGLQRYEIFLVRDLMQHVTRTFHVRPGRWGIGGHSMGGFGAMRVGCKYPDRFASIWAHSGAYYTREEMETYYPDPVDADVYGHVDNLAQSEHNVTVTFDCGVEDTLVDHARRLHVHMDKVGLAHQYHENSGGHTWEYWDLHVQKALEQHARVLASAST